MSTQRYSVTPQPIDTLLHWIKIGEISIPEIQRPFVWEATKVRNLLDSLYQGYPVGYLIAWRNPTVKLKDGTLLLARLQHKDLKMALLCSSKRTTSYFIARTGERISTSSPGKQICLSPLIPAKGRRLTRGEKENSPQTHFARNPLTNEGTYSLTGCQLFRGSLKSHPPTPNRERGTAVASLGSLSMDTKAILPMGAGGAKVSQIK